MKKELATMATGLALALTASAAFADSSSSRTVTGPRGESATVERSVTRENGERTRSVTGSTSTGRGFDREVTRSIDRETGTITREGEGSTERGGTWSSEGSLVCEDGKCSREGSVVGPRGNTRSIEREAERVGKRRWHGTVDRSGPRGERTRNWRRIVGDR